MEPLTMIALGGGAALLLSRLGKGKGTPKPGVAPSGFEPFAPAQQGAAWYAATALQWVPAGDIGDNAGRVAQTFRGGAQGNAEMNRAANDAFFRSAMAQGLRVVVSASVLDGSGGVPPYLLLAPDGFSRASVPSDWGPIGQLYAPPPGSFGAPNMGPMPPGGDYPMPPSGGGDPFDEIPDPSTRAKVRELVASDSAGLLDLDEVAKQLDAAGYSASAAAVRERRKRVALKRQLEAKERGGWLYVIRKGDAMPVRIAQYYGGVRPRVLEEMAAINPTVAANKWAGWLVGQEILLPGSWPDPSLKPAPPFVTGKAPGTAPAPSTPTSPQTPPGAKPGYYVDPATGLPIMAPAPFPGAAPPGSLGAATPAYATLAPQPQEPGWMAPPGSMGAAAPPSDWFPGEVPLVGGAWTRPILSQFGGS